MRTTVDIPEGLLLRRARARAALAGTKMKDVVNELRHLTNPSIMGDEILTNTGASRLLHHLRIQDAVLFASEPLGLDALFPAAGESPEPHRHWWTDAYLAAFAISGNHELVTFDRGFGRYEAHGLRWRLLQVSG